MRQQKRQQKRQMHRLKQPPERWMQQPVGLRRASQLKEVSRVQRAQLRSLDASSPASQLS